MAKRQQGIDPLVSDKVSWLVEQIFSAFPRDVTGLKFCILDCGCIYYETVILYRKKLFPKFRVKL